MRTLANPIYGTGVVGKEGRVQGGTSRNGKNRMLRRSLHKSVIFARQEERTEEHGCVRPLWCPPACRALNLSIPASCETAASPLQPVPLQIRAQNAPPPFLQIRDFSNQP